MGIVKQIKAMGLGFVCERVFERIVPAWMCRFSSVAVYQVDSNRFSNGRISSAVLKICDSTDELEQLEDVTKASGDPDGTIGIVALMGREVAGGLWVALGDYRDHDLGLSFLLGKERAWIYAARVEESYRRRGIYSHLMAESVRVRNNAGHEAPFIGVSKLNKGSHKAIQRFSRPVGEVHVLRLGSMVWARTKGDLEHSHNLTLKCTHRPIQISMSQTERPKTAGRLSTVPV